MARNPVLGMSAQAEGEGRKPAGLALYLEQDYASQLSAEALPHRGGDDDRCGRKWRRISKVNEPFVTRN